MDEVGVSLEELSEETGVEKRTLRHWVSQDLLSPPFQAGRNASYPKGNIERALAVKSLRENYGMSLSAIRQELLLADEKKIEAWAAEARGEPPPTADALETPRLSSALEYLKSVQAEDRRALQRGEEERPRRMADERPLNPKEEYLRRRAEEERQRRLDFERGTPAPSRSEIPPDAMLTPKDLSGIEALLSVLEQSVRRKPGRRSKGEHWFRIEITPDIEITVRGELPPRELALLERIADLIRAILIGGRHDY